MSSLEPVVDAQEQASIREQAADYTLDGKQVPDELVRKYNQAERTTLDPMHAAARRLQLRYRRCFCEWLELFAAVIFRSRLRKKPSTITVLCLDGSTLEVK